MLQFYNLAIRAVGLGSKFLFLLLAPKYLALEDIGSYGIVNTTINLGIYFLGFEFYTYYTRDIALSSKSTISKYFFNQIVFYGFSYFLFLPFLYFFIYFEFLPIEFILPLTLLLIVEHLNQELFRVFVAIKKALTANLLLSIKALWVFIILFDWFFADWNIGIVSILYVWLFVSSFSLLLATYLLFSKNEYYLTFTLDKSWIKKGISVSFIFFIGSLSIKLVQFGNRFFLEKYAGKALLGEFIFFDNIASIINIVVYTGIVSVLLPDLIYESTQSNDRRLKIFRKFSLQIVVTSLILALLLFLVFPYVTQLSEKIESNGNLPIFGGLLIGYVFQSLSLIPHYILYIKRKDKALLSISIAIAISSFILNWLLVSSYGLFGASLALLFSYVLSFLIKIIVNKKIR